MFHSQPVSLPFVMQLFGYDARSYGATANYTYALGDRSVVVNSQSSDWRPNSLAEPITVTTYANDGVTAPEVSKYESLGAFLRASYPATFYSVFGV